MITDGMIAVLAGPAARRRRWLPGLLLAAGLAAACRVGEGPEAGPTPAGEPPIVSGPVSAEDEAAAALALGRAREAYARGEHEAARDAARRVIESFPRAPGSSLALRMFSESSYQLGAYADAATAAERYASLFRAADRRAAAARLLAGRSHTAAGDSVRAIEVLVEIPHGAPGAEEALELMRGLADGLDSEALERVALSLAPGRALATPVLTEYAVALHFRGEEERAAEIARLVLAAQPAQDERRIAAAVLERRLEDVLGAAPLLGALVPQSGAPYLLELAGQVEEGVRLAVSAYQAELRRPVRLEVHDDLANPVAAARLVEALERSGALAVVGPIMAAAVEAAAGARRGPLPIVSPTARSLPGGVEGVYSLMGPDPTAARTLAEYARRVGIATAAVMYPRTALAGFEAAVFAETFRAGGGRVVLELPYDPSVTTFQEPLARVAAARPGALFLPLGERDIPIVAPQVAYYGVDTLGIRILGTAAWADDATLRRVDPRSTNRVIAAAPLAADSSNAAYLSFVRAYEETYRKSLRGPLPAYGYDAAALVLDAVRRRADSPAGVRRALEATTDFPGATGAISVRDGRIVRRHRLVALEGGRPVPIERTRR